MNQYMLVLRGNDPELRNFSANDVQEIMQRYHSWFEQLKKDKLYRAGAPLKLGSKVLSLSSNGITITDGPFTESKELMSGYIIIEAADIDEAVRISRDCPALTHGETVEAIQLG